MHCHSEYSVIVVGWIHLDIFSCFPSHKRDENLIQDDTPLKVGSGPWRLLPTLYKKPILQPVLSIKMIEPILHFNLITTNSSGGMNTIFNHHNLQRRNENV
jgi:hypothetical protein